MRLNQYDTYRDEQEALEEQRRARRKPVTDKSEIMLHGILCALWLGVLTGLALDATDITELPRIRIAAMICFTVIAIGGIFFRRWRKRDLTRETERRALKTIATQHDGTQQ